MSVPVVSGRDCRTYVQQQLPFRNKGDNIWNHPNGATLWGEWTIRDLYVVYSYRRSWPLYICWKGVWFANASKVSRTTTRHSSLAHPLCQTVPLTVDKLCLLVLSGRPSNKMLIDAAKLGHLPEALVPEVTALMIGVQS